MSDVRDIAVKYALLLSAPDYSQLLNEADRIAELESMLATMNEAAEESAKWHKDQEAEINRLSDAKNEIIFAQELVCGELREEITRLRELLKVALCPYCDGSGSYYELYMRSNADGQPCEDREEVLCQFCDERNKALEDGE